MRTEVYVAGVWCARRGVSLSDYGSLGVPPPLKLTLIDGLLWQRKR